MTVSPILRVPLAALAAWLAALSAHADAPPAAEYSAAVLRARLQASMAPLHSLLAEYVGNDYPIEDGWPPGTFVRRMVAAKSPCLMFHENSHGSDASPWESDPLWTRLYLTDATWTTERVLSRSYRSGPWPAGVEVPGSLPREFFLRTTGLWPLDKRPPPRPDGQPYMLCEVARCEQFCVVRAKLESCDGHWCHVLEWPKVDRLWLDTRRGCALLARETCDFKSGAIFQRIELGGHREVQPGIWMPAWIRCVQFDEQADTEQGRRRVVADATTRVTRIEVNTVQDDQFVFKPLPGALWLNPPAGSPTQTTPGGLDHLDALKDWARSLRPPPPRPLLGSIWRCVGAACAGMIAIEVLLRARSRWLRPPRREEALP